MPPAVYDEAGGPEEDMLNRWEASGRPLGVGINPIGVGAYTGQPLANTISQAVPAALDTAQAGLDVAGMADPTPVSDTRATASPPSRPTDRITAPPSGYAYRPSMLKEIQPGCGCSDGFWKSGTSATCRGGKLAM